MVVVTPVLLLLVLLIVFFVGLAVFVRGWHGVPTLSEPCCAKCGYDLRGFAGAPPTVCNECGSDLTRARAIRWGKHQRRPRMMWAGAALCALPLLAIATMALGGRSLARRPAQASRSNAALISALKNTANQPWDWQEIEQRHAAGRLSNAEAGEALDHLIASLATLPTPGQQPLSWARPVVEQFDGAGAITDEQFLRLAQAFYGNRPTVRLGPAVREKSTPRFSVEFAGPWDLPGVQNVKALRQVKTPDGRTVELAPEYDFGAPGEDLRDPDQFSAQGSNALGGRLKLDLPPGEHTLTFVVDAGVLREGTAPQILQNRPGQAAHWPRPRARWTMEVPVKLTVVPAGQSPVELVNDAALDPQKSGVLRVKRAAVIRTGKGPRLRMELDVSRVPVPVSFDVFVKVAGEEVAVGHHVTNHEGHSWTGELAHTFAALAPEVQSFDVSLRPNPAHAEALPGIGRIWGGTVELKNVPLQRHDLDTGDEPPAQ
jgi:hypothetical protein